ncbi:MULTISPECIES: hypothetical protein [unclassified Maridesulfovibrio]|uniref:hypothetical protein n=1 Tax=unclassified Maridesulfovibrio TaxID=2794999 RepID=UPI003B3F71F6
MIADALLSIVTGGATGLLGSIFTGVFSYFEDKRKNAHEIEMRKLDMKEMDKEWEYRQRAADREAETRLEESADDLMELSYQHDSSSILDGHDLPGWSVWLLIPIEALRKLVRPGLTVFLIWLVWTTRCEVLDVIKQSNISVMDPKTALGIYQQVINTILYCATTALLWWFGTRKKKESK